VRKALLAECLGTLGIVFAPCLLSATGKLPGGDPSLLAMSLVSGLAVTAMIGAVGHLSGAHLNPAVSLGLASVGKFPWKSVPGYVLAQCLGSALAAGLVRLLFGPGLFGAHVPLAGYLAQALALEAVLGFFLMWLVMAATDERTKNSPHGLIIGIYVVVAMLIAGRSLRGGAIFSARLSAHFSLPGSTKNCVHRPPKDRNTTRIVVFYNRIVRMNVAAETLS
jgi:glycerol uptake facilitator-like aquaporin